MEPMCNHEKKKDNEMKGICYVSLLHTSAPLQQSVFPSGRTFLHISKQI